MDMYSNVNFEIALKGSWYSMKKHAVNVISDSNNDKSINDDVNSFPNRRRP